mgnify:CR=1 FL=1
MTCQVVSSSRNKGLLSSYHHDLTVQSSPQLHFEETFRVMKRERRRIPCEEGLLCVPYSVIDHTGVAAKLLQDIPSLNVPQIDEAILRCPNNQRLVGTEIGSDEILGSVLVAFKSSQGPSLGIT